MSSGKRKHFDWISFLKAMYAHVHIKILFKTEAKCVPSVIPKT